MIPSFVRLVNPHDGKVRKKPVVTPVFSCRAVWKGEKTYEGSRFFGKALACRRNVW